MQLTVLGCESPFPGPGGACPAYLLQSAAGAVLVDCGVGAVARLQERVAVHEIGALCLSHLHPDHSADLYQLGFLIWTAQRRGERTAPLVVFGPPGAGRMFQSILRTVGGLDEVLGPALEWHEYDPRLEVDLPVAGLSLRALPVEHALDCHALRIEGPEGQAFAYSGDSRYCPGLVEIAKEADVFLCEAAASDQEVAAKTNHLMPAEAGEVAEKAGCRKLLLTHFLPGVDRQAKAREAATKFRGPVETARALAVYRVT